MTANQGITWEGFKLSSNVDLFCAPSCPNSLARTTGNIALALADDHKGISVDFWKIGEGSYGKVFRAPLRPVLWRYVFKIATVPDWLKRAGVNPEICIGLSSMRADIAIEYGLGRLAAEKSLPLRASLPGRGSSIGEMGDIDVTAPQHYAGAFIYNSEGICTRSVTAMTYRPGTNPDNWKGSRLSADALSAVLDAAVTRSGLPRDSVDPDMHFGTRNTFYRAAGQTTQLIKFDSMATRPLLF